jgi:hypothetical protein
MAFGGSVFVANVARQNPECSFMLSGSVADYNFLQAISVGREIARVIRGDTNGK